MHRLRFGSVLAAAALATAAVIPILATPAGAASTCSAGEYPASFEAQSGLKVGCVVDAGTNVNHIEIHDADNAVWHHGAARAVSLAPSSGNAITAGSNTIHFAAGKLKPADLRRPINAFNAAKAAMLAGGSFITSVLPSGCTTACTSATLSQKATVTGGTASLPITAKVEHTTNRMVDDASCSGGGSTVTSATAKWVAADVNKSVSGGPFSSGTFIISVSGTVATLNQPHTNACTPYAGPPAHPGDEITIGSATYSGGNPQVFNGDPSMLNLSNTVVGGSGFTCSGSVLGMTAAAKTDTGGFVATDVGLAATVRSVTAVVTSTTITAVSLSGNTSATLAAACPSGGVTATAGKTPKATIGAASAGAPVNNGAMMTLAAELNLNPALVGNQDDCNLNTIEGFMVVGGWESPGAFADNTSTPPVAVGQVLFPTSVIAFTGFIVPKKGGDTSDANPHYNFSFPLLPTGVAECLSGGGTQNPTGLALGMNPTTMTLAPFLPTGSGNPADPPVRQLLPETGSFDTITQLMTASVVNNTFTSSCTIGADTDPPSYPCGDG